MSAWMSRALRKYLIASSRILKPANETMPRWTYVRAVTGWLSRPAWLHVSMAALSSLRASSKFRFWYSSTAFLLSLVTFSTAAESSAAARAVDEVAPRTTAAAGRARHRQMSKRLAIGRGMNGGVNSGFRKRWAVLPEVAPMYHAQPENSRPRGTFGRAAV